MKFYDILRITSTSITSAFKAADELEMYFEDNPILSDEIIFIKLHED